jgi:protein-disulfide isomerase
MRSRAGSLRLPAALGAVLGLVAAACASTAVTAPETTAAESSTTTTSTTTTTTVPAYEHPTSFTDEGYPLLGDPDAPVSLVEYSDYLCPYCGRHFTVTAPALIARYVENGEVNFVFRDFPLADLHPTAAAGHAAALCVAEQDSGLFWAYHDRLFEEQETWKSIPFAAQYFENLAEEVGADLGAYLTCIESGRTVELVDGRVAEARAQGFGSTPSFQIVDNRTGDVYEIIGSQPLAVFTEALDAVVAGESLPDVAAPEPPQLPYWASVQGLQPDPDRPGFTLAGDAYRGDPAAPLVVIEVSDFQCPFCRRHTLDTQPAIDEGYVDTGEILWVFKHLPLPIHPQAQLAGAAAECAGDQGAFWEMHDLLFETVDEWAVDPPDEVLVGLAAELGLDTGAFADCLDGRQALERVLSDFNELSGVISSTPTFILIKDGRAQGISGAQPFEVFQNVFDQVLDG